MIRHLYFDKNTNSALCELNFDGNSYQGGQALFPYLVGPDDRVCEKCIQINSAYCIFLSQRSSKARSMMEVLNIKYSNSLIYITDLYDILNDENKFKELSVKLKMKLFW